MSGPVTRAAKGAALSYAEGDANLEGVLDHWAGASEPSPTRAYMFWSDTGTGFLKIRNAANNAWITVGTLASVFLGLADLATAQTWTKAQRGAIVALTDGATITPNFADGNNFIVTLGGNRTLANGTNVTAGQSGLIWVLQDATGNRTLSYGTDYEFENSDVPALSTGANAVDIIGYAVRASGSIQMKWLGNFG